MKTAFRCALVIFAILIAASLASAQHSSGGGHESIRSILDHRLSAVERDLVPAAEAMPEEKYTFVPTSGEFKGVNSFAQQVKHIAGANFLYFSAFAPDKPPAGGEMGPANMTSKADIVKFLRDSFAYAHRAIATITDQNAVETVKSEFGEGTRLGFSVGAMAHAMDHYGQIVEYLRLNGIIPPASRR